MTRSPARSRRARFGLLFAALLHVFGAAVGPLAHHHLRANPAAETVSPASESEGGRSAEGEFACRVCHALGAIFLPTGASYLELPGTAAASLVGPDERFSAAARFTSRQARAPPVF